MDDKLYEQNVLHVKCVLRKDNLIQRSIILYNVRCEL